jgi:hypothetical protein
MIPIRSPYLPAVFVLAFLTTTTFGEQPVGPKYGSREPKTCQAAKEPTKGVLSAALAVKYTACGMEREVNENTLYLVEDLKVEVGGGTPFLQIPEIHRPGGADPKGIVYAIRGSFKQYQCGVSHPTGILKNAGANCRIYNTPKAEGTCFRDNFGEWSCHLLGDQGYGTAGQPPPL